MGEQRGATHGWHERLCAAGFEVFAADHTRSRSVELRAGAWFTWPTRTVGTTPSDDVGLLARASPKGAARNSARPARHSMGSLLVVHFDARARAGRRGGALRTSGPTGRAIALALWSRGSSAFGSESAGRRSPPAHALRAVQRAFVRARRTACEWLSRDRSEVAKYVADPLCGFVLTVGGICELAAALWNDVQNPRRSRAYARVPVLCSPASAIRCTTPARFHALARGFARRPSSAHGARLPGRPDEMLNETNANEVTPTCSAGSNRVSRHPCNNTCTTLCFRRSCSNTNPVSIESSSKRSSQRPGRAPSGVMQLGDAYSARHDPSLPCPA